MVIVPMGKFLLAFLEKGKILKGEREKPIYWCMLFELTLFFSFLVFFPFLSVFVLIFFLFLLLCFSFHLMRYTLCFSAPSTGHGKGLFIVPAVTSVLLSCPLTPFVWPGCTCRPYCATQNPCQTETDSFLSSCASWPFLPRC